MKQFAFASGCAKEASLKIFTPYGETRTDWGAFRNIAISSPYSPLLMKNHV